jgi:hypothetical protein
MPFDYVADERIVVAFENEGGSLIDGEMTRNAVGEFKSQAKKCSMKVGFIGRGGKVFRIKFVWVDHPEGRPIAPSGMVIGAKLG